MEPRTDHEECSSGRNYRALPRNITDVLSRQTDGDDSPEEEDFFDQRRNVRHFLLPQAGFPCVAIRLDFMYRLEGLLLYCSSLWGSERRHPHDEVARDGVNPGGYHCQANRFDFGCASWLCQPPFLIHVKHCCDRDGPSLMLASGSLRMFPVMHGLSTPFRMLSFNMPNRAVMYLSRLILYSSAPLLPRLQSLMTGTLSCQLLFVL